MIKQSAPGDHLTRTIETSLLRRRTTIADPGIKNSAAKKAKKTITAASREKKCMSWVPFGKQGVVQPSPSKGSASCLGS